MAGRRFDRIGWAMAQDGLSSPQKFVLVVLADAANEDEGTCWLKHNTIAERTALGVSTVRHALAAMIEMDLIRAGVRYDKRGRQTSNLYQLGCYESVAEGVRSEHPEGATSGQGEVSAPDTSYVNRPEATGLQSNKRKKTSSSPSSRTRSARSSIHDELDTSRIDEIGDEIRPGTRPQPVTNTRRVTRSRKSPAEHTHAPQRRNAAGLACYWGRELEKVGSLEKSEEAVVGKFFKVWLERGLAVEMGRRMIDAFFADLELAESTHRWKRFVANAETLRQRVIHRVDYYGTADAVEVVDPRPFAWIESLPPALREVALAGSDVA